MSSESTVIFTVRIPQSTADVIRKVARQRGQSLSGFLRLVLYQELARLSYLSEEEKKALGVKSIASDN